MLHRFKTAVRSLFFVVFFFSAVLHDWDSSTSILLFLHRELGNATRQLGFTCLYFVVLKREVEKS